MANLKPQLSLKNCLIFYIILFAFLAVFLSTLTNSLCLELLNNLHAKYPIDGPRYYLTTADGRQLGEGVIINGQQEPYSSTDKLLAALLDVLPQIATALYIILAVLGAVFCFYKHKLQKPLALLMTASKQIAQNDLNFALDYPVSDEMGQLCASFETMRQALIESNQQLWQQIERRQQLNAAFAHDLRTPLTVLKGYLEMAQLQQTNCAEILPAMVKQVNRLEQYGATMSCLGRLEDITPNFTPTNLADFFAELTADAALLAENGHKELTVATTLATVDASIDSEMITEIFDNLFSNAIRYAQQKIHIDICQQNKQLILTITDDGSGFSPEAKVKAFDAYFSEYPADGVHFGLGLYIANLLAEKHNGVITIANNNGGCVRCIFELTF